MFITLEGPEGGGKSTLAASLAQRLANAGYSVVTTREPGGTELGRQIRKMLLEQGEVTARSELMLFLADRAQHVQEVILPALSNGKVVLCDRFTDSTLVYQGYARGLDLQMLRSANHWATDGLSPDLTLLLDIDPDVGLERLESKDRLDSEPIEFHQKVRKGFLTEASINPERIQILSADRPVNVVESDAWELVSKRVSAHLAGSFEVPQ